MKSRTINTALTHQLPVILKTLIDFHRLFRFIAAAAAVFLLEFGCFSTSFFLFLCRSPHPLHSDLKQADRDIE